jgi:two-component system chemotaxis sensor kinase CheA
MSGVAAAAGWRPPRSTFSTDSSLLMDDQLLSEFLAEAEDLLDELRRDLAALRARRAEGRARRELVGRIFRRVHTLKGSAAAAGLAGATALAHEFESLLDAVRGGRAAVNEEVLDAFDEALDALASDLGAAARGREAAGRPALAARLRRLAAGGAPPPTLGAVEALLPAAVERAMSEHERQRGREAAAEGAALFIVDVSFDLSDFDERFRRLCASLGERGEVVSTLPGVDASSPERVGFRLVHATEETRDELDARLKPFGASINEGDDDADDGSEEGAAAQSASSLTMLVRVSLEELDDLISATHELFGETAAALEGAGGAASVARAEGVRRRFRELEERLIGLRMVPVGATLERAARAGRTVARAAGKEVDFEVAGGDVRLDKSLAERVADPLLHLLRNAVDHGVEPPAERVAAGKPARARVRLEAAAEGGRVRLRVSDDGRGVDLESVARAAAERGLVAPDARVSEEQALRLIFRPGFSTVARATAVSGRGVGLDVVERAVEAAGGELRVSSLAGRGTSFELRLPTTLALATALVVRAGDRRYCLDVRRVVEWGEAAREEFADGGRAVVWRGASLPVVGLRALVGLPEETEAGGAGRVPLVVARVPARRGEGAEERTMAVVVDGVEGRGEFLVRGLGRHAARWRGVSGATELGDGTVALVLDLAQL